jgi:hypothetical protein
VLPPLL